MSKNPIPAPQVNKMFKPTFSIWDTNKKFKPGVISAFLSKETIDLSAFSGFLYDSKGRKYEAVFDFNVDKVIIPADMQLHVMVSFQFRMEGSFAVIRMLKDTEKTK